MDQFLHSIWIAEENQATNTQAASATANGNNVNAKQNLLYKSNAKGIPKQTNLPRQGSLSIQKTVDEVWSDIHKDQQQDINDTCVQNPNTTQRRPTFEEMALEDFLVKSGVIREQNHPHPWCNLNCSNMEYIQTEIMQWSLFCGPACNGARVWQWW